MSTSASVTRKYNTQITIETDKLPLTAFVNWGDVYVCFDRLSAACFDW